MCGNGIRCLARFVADVDGQTELKYKIHTLAGERMLLVTCYFWHVSLLTWTRRQSSSTRSTHWQVSKAMPLELVACDFLGTEATQSGELAWQERARAKAVSTWVYCQNVMQQSYSQHC
jgi:diaminopimelate epimerase